MKELKLKTKKAVKKTIIRQRLSEGHLNFAFIKKDGSVRIANGTTNLDLIPQKFHPKGNGKESDKVIAYLENNIDVGDSVNEVITNGSFDISFSG